MYFDHHYPVTELNTKLLVTNMENNDRKKDTKLKRDRTRDSGNLEILEDQTTEYIHRNQRLVNGNSDKRMDNNNNKKLILHTSNK